LQEGVQQIFWKDTDRPELASEWTIEKQDEAIFLARSESNVRILRGAVLAALLPYVDGRRTVAQLLREAEPKMQEKIRATLDLLEEQGLVTRQSATKQSRPESAYWRLMGADHSVVDQRRGEATCRITVPEDEWRAPIEEALASLGVRVTDDGAFRVVVARDYLDERLRDINDECFAKGAAWMLVRPFGRRHWMGPLFQPGKTGCWDCLAWWLTINGWSASAVVADLEALTRTTLRLAGVEAAKWLLTGHSETIEGRIQEFDTGSLVFTDHRLIPRPSCPHCRGEAGTPMELDRIQSPLTGIMSHLEPIRNWAGVAVCTGESSQKVGIDGTGTAYYCSPQTTFGVAETAGEAATICRAEAVERFCVRFQGDEPIVPRSRRQLGSHAVGPAALLIPAQGDDPDATIGWVEAISLISGDRRFLPASYVYLGYDSSYFEADTNGCAAGITLEAATMTALLELIERDGVALWWYNRARRPAVDLRATRSRRIDAALAVVGECGKQAHVLDLRTDFGIPVCVAVAFGDAPGIALGCAAHPEPERCVWKALAGMSAVMARLEAPIVGRHQWLEDARIEDYPHLMPAGQSAHWEAKRKEEVPTTLAQILERAEALRMDILRVTLTRPELGIPVVRIVAPGLRPVARCLAPGRLYDIPVNLGWIPRALSDDQMNPMPFAL
jgi:ribosomal protein S12 methylthiotransferase accessory factor